MKVNEFKIHVMRGLLRPEYFYIPVIAAHNNKPPVRFKITDEFGEDAFITEMYLSYYADSLAHDYHQDESGNSIYDYDENSKGYVFNTDYEWRFPVPNPSEFEIYPLPDLTNFDIKATNGTIQKYSTYFYVNLNEPQTLIEIENLPAGIYYVSVMYSTGVFSANYYPEYYVDDYMFYADDSMPTFDPQKEWHKGDFIAANGIIFVCQYDYKPGDTIRGDLFRAKKDGYPISSSPYGMIDRNGFFSGYYRNGVYNQQSPYNLIGYNFYGITKKFGNNTMPIVLYYRRYSMQLNKTDEYGKKIVGIKFKLHSESGRFTSTYPYFLYATVNSRTADDIIFTTTSTQYAVNISQLGINDVFSLTEIEAPEGYRLNDSTVQFYYTKVGECVYTTPQSEYIKYSDSKLDIVNKKLNRRLKMIITLVDAPEGEVSETVRTASPLGYGIHNEHGYWGQYFFPVPPATESDIITGTEYGSGSGNSMLIRGGYYTEETTTILCNKIFLAKFYLDGEYKGCYTQYAREYPDPQYTVHDIVGYDSEKDALIYSPEIPRYALVTENRSEETTFMSFGNGTDPYLFYKDSGINVYATNDPYNTDAPIYGKLWRKSVCSIFPGRLIVNSTITGILNHYLITDGVTSIYKYTQVDPLNRHGGSESTYRERRYVYNSFDLNYSGGRDAYVSINCNIYDTKNGETTVEDMSSSVDFDLRDIKTFLAFKENTSEYIFNVPFTKTDSNGFTTYCYYYVGEGLTVADIDEFISIAETEDMDVELDI